DSKGHTGGRAAIAVASAKPGTSSRRCVSSKARAAASRSTWAFALTEDVISLVSPVSSGTTPRRNPGPVPQPAGSASTTTTETGPLVVPPGPEAGTGPTGAEDAAPAEPGGSGHAKAIARAPVVAPGEPLPE